MNWIGEGVQGRDREDRAAREGQEILDMQELRHGLCDEEMYRECLI